MWMCRCINMLNLLQPNGHMWKWYWSPAYICIISHNGCCGSSCCVEQHIPTWLSVISVFAALMWPFTTEGSLLSIGLYLWVSICWSTCSQCVYVCVSVWVCMYVWEAVPFSHLDAFGKRQMVWTAGLLLSNGPHEDPLNERRSHRLSRNERITKKQKFPLKRTSCRKGLNHYRWGSHW